MSDQPTNNSKELPLGTIIFSILPPAYFAAEHSGKWELLEGQQNDMSSELYNAMKLYGDGRFLDNLPDARGYFFRAMNLDGAGIDPETNRNVGSVQTDSTAKPRNLKVRVSKDGKHSHRYGNDQSCHENQYNSIKDSDNKGKKRTSEDGLHNHTVSITGWDTETRPNNLAFYVYIKVN